MIRGPCGDLNKWILKIRSRVKKFEIGSIKGVFTDFLEFDQTLGMIMEEYNAQRRFFQKDLMNQFMRQIESNVGAVSLGTYQNMIDNALPVKEEEKNRY